MLCWRGLGRPAILPIEGKLPGTEEREVACMETGRKRGNALYGAACLLVLWAWYVVLHDPVYQGILHRWWPFGSPPMALSLPDAGVYEASDPPLGTPFPTTGLGAQIRKQTPPNQRGYLIAAMGDCATCTALSLPKLYSQTKARRISLLAFAYGEAERVRQLAASFRREGMDIPFYHDADRRLTMALNSYYPGRLYYYTSDWRLRWRERDMQIDNYLFTTGRFDRLMENTK
jgi:hypothetical protein